ncbi:MAG: PadR family transcriptional regulator [Imperialibacter sp.]|uniref:PadR family transcriptional regulator n=1 Tax=Imperialibacter sp. TaxID=2038411 RepID=UPI0030D7B878|tara:strand:+ start:278 stop:604 length:327 start_codon:yes stop_codon:yes gene_type:complete
MNLQLGVLEEMILILLLMKQETYGVDIAQEYEKQLGQSISLPAIHVVLKRLESKGLVSSYMGEATAERGGRSKRMYKASSKGFQVAKSLQDNRTRMWGLVPKLNFSPL